MRVGVLAWESAPAPAGRVEKRAPGMIEFENLKRISEGRQSIGRSGAIALRG
jgi:hypothetical protein